MKSRSFAENVRRKPAEETSSRVSENIPRLAVSSSVTAETFYARLGFRSVRDSYYGDERTIIMERLLDEPL